MTNKNKIITNIYRPISDKDIQLIRGMPAVCDQPCIDITSVLRKKLPGASLLEYLCYVYKWGYLQGKRDVSDWHGQKGITNTPILEDM